MTSQDSPCKRVLIVDDHPVMAKGLEMLLNRESGLNVCGRCEDAERALEIVESLDADLAIVDISLPGMNGLDLIKQLKKQAPHISILVYSMHEETLYAERALRAGARGYVMKRDEPENVLAAVRQVLEGRVAVSQEVHDRMLDRMTEAPSSKPPVDTLSDRELEIYHLIGHGFKTGEIAKRLNISANTVETYRARLKQKLGLQTSSDLTRHANEWVRSQAG